MESDVAKKTITTTSPEDTRALGRALAGILRPGDVVILSGTLGAGKTCFVSGLAEGLGVRSHVSSPTFTLLHTHEPAREGGLSLHHLDVYRLRDGGDFLNLGFGDLLSGDAVTVIEWGGLVRDALPDSAAELIFRFTDDSGSPEQEESRIITCSVPEKDADRFFAAIDAWERRRSG